MKKSKLCLLFFVGGGLVLCLGQVGGLAIYHHVGGIVFYGEEAPLLLLLAIVVITVFNKQFQANAVIQM